MHQARISITAEDAPPQQTIKKKISHYSHLLFDLVHNGSIRFAKPLHTKVTFHDPCYLGRHNHIYDIPRQVIRAIPGIQLVEMAYTRHNSHCCGGGGGRMWQQELDADVKMSEVRIKEAAETEADILITACPLCLVMLEDALKTTGLEASLQVLDLNELVTMALELNEVAED
ncbi:(Fe-S)-binding protein [candidate division CSSED10-310 bacterium]|uniref:(Fe-S)-binding protein n=1 Tax=candidate division CSSED10-310 bacterium TaxID=2855610 RepID=A0ABV6Z0G0_UNCC1